MFRLPFQLVSKYLTALGLALLLAWAPDAPAGTTGKIRGLITDMKGQPLPDVNIAVVGTRQGATTDVNGFYVILALEPGEYTITASFISYQSRSISEIRVSADHTSVVDLELEETSLEETEVIVTAKRRIIDLDQTASKYSVTSKDLEEIPMIRDITSLLALQPGLDATGSSVIRGGNNGPWSRDITYYIDGVRLVTNDGGSSNDTGLFEELNISAIREVQVVVGGMEAEYGNVQGGVVNIITKDGSKDFTGRAEYKATLPTARAWSEEDPYENFRQADPALFDSDAWRNQTATLPGDDGRAGTADDSQEKIHDVRDYTGIWGHRVEAMASGSISSSISWVAAASTVRIPGTGPAPNPYGYYTSQRTEAGLPPSIGGFTNAPRNLRLNTKLSFRPTDKIALKLGAIYAGSNVLEGGRSSGSPLIPPGETTSGVNRRRDGIYSLSLNHALSPRTFYQIRLSDFATRIDTSAVPSTNTSIVDTTLGFPTTIYRKQHAYDVADRHRQQASLELFHQLSKVHFIRAGADFTRYRTWTQSARAFGDRPVYLQSDIAAGAENVSGYPLDTNWKYNNDASASWSGLTGNGLPIGRGGTPFEPKQFSAYFSDKMEQQGTFMTVGVRFDALWPEIFLPSLPGATEMPMFGNYAHYMAVRPGFDPVADIQNPDARYLPLTKAEPIYQVSPRFGMAARVTEDMLLRVSTGSYYQVPPFTTNFGSSWIGSSNDLNGNGGIDDSEWLNEASGDGPRARFLAPEKTINIEFGMDWNFVLDYTVGMTLYYKKATEQQLPGAGQTIVFDPAEAQLSRDREAAIVGPDGFGDVRGLELAFHKNFKRYFGIRASYNWNQTAGEVSSNESFRILVPDSGFVAAGGWWNEWEQRSDGSLVPVIPDADTRASWGRIANQELRRLLRSDGTTLEVDGPVPGMHSFTVQEFIGPDAPGNTATDSSTASRLQGSRRQTGSVMLVFASPLKVGPSIGGVSVFGGWRSNLIYRMATGLEVVQQESPFFPGDVVFKMPIQSRVDVSLSRTLFRKKNGFQAELYAEAQNVFNDRNWRPSQAAVEEREWLRYGLPVWPAIFATVSPEEIEAGDTAIYTNDTESPRFTEVGFRFYW